MTDLLLKLAANPTATRLARRLSLPVPLPQTLKRTEDPWEEEPLAGCSYLVGPAGTCEWQPELRTCLADAGANAVMHPEQNDATERRASTRSGATYDGLVFDASGIQNLMELGQIYHFFHQQLSQLKPNGRIVILRGQRSHSATDATRNETTGSGITVRTAHHDADYAYDPTGRQTPLSAVNQAIDQALIGFTKSLAKETGHRGTTVQVLFARQGTTAENFQQGVAPFLRFLMSRRAAYISGQSLQLTSLVSPPQRCPRTLVLNGKTALVTGAANGIGRKIAQYLEREGAHVIAVDRPDQSQQLQQTLRGTSGRPVLVDLGDQDAAEAVKAILPRTGFDILVNNAGVTRDKTLRHMSADQWHQTVDLNLSAAVGLTEALLPSLRDHGRILFLSSIAGIAGNRGQTNYALAKAGLMGYVQGRCESLASRNITINAVAPGFIETQMTAKIPFAVREMARRLCALSQGGLPGDVAHAITFLASPEAAPMTGQTLRVCGLNFVGA